MKKATTKSYALRIDAPLVKPLQELKKQNRRSLNAEINAALEAWVATAQRPTATAEITAETDGAVKPARAKKQSKRKNAAADAISDDGHATPDHAHVTPDDVQATPDDADAASAAHATSDVDSNADQ